jgi:hypothetical protein
MDLHSNPWGIDQETTSISNIAVEHMHITPEHIAVEHSTQHLAPEQAPNLDLNIFENGFSNRNSSVASLNQQNIWDPLNTVCLLGFCRSCPTVQCHF